jgi:hypothetical protein
MMKNRLKITFISLSMLGLTGCMGVASPVVGLIYTDAKFGDQVTDVTTAPKTGEACAETWFTLVARGDASVEAAKANGGITQVAVVDHSAKNILGIWGKFCTIVKGQ